MLDPCHSPYTDDFHYRKRGRASIVHHYIDVIFKVRVGLRALLLDGRLRGSDLQQVKVAISTAENLADCCLTDGFAEGLLEPFAKDPSKRAMSVKRTVVGSPLEGGRECRNHHCIEIIAVPARPAIVTTGGDCKMGGSHQTCVTYSPP
jgi:hypothetical protein